jgi:hypothetical protein
MVEISPASSSSDREEDLLFEELLDEASLAVQFVFLVPVGSISR